MHVERKKNKYGEAFFILRMSEEERNDILEDFTYGINISVKEKYREELIKDVSFLKELGHTQYDKEDEISVLFPSSRIGEILTSLLVIGSCEGSALKSLKEIINIKDERINQRDELIDKQDKAIDKQDEAIDKQDELIDLQNKIIDRLSILAKECDTDE